MIAKVVSALAGMPPQTDQIIGRSIPEQIPQDWYWLGAILALAIFFLFRLNPLRLVGWFFRVLSRSILRILRALRIIRAVRRPGPASSWFGLFGSSVARVFVPGTKTDVKLEECARKHDDNIQRKRGLFFRWLHPTAATVPRDETTDPKVEFARAHELFHFDIPMREILEGDAHQFFYEDVHSELIIRLFRGEKTAEWVGELEAETNSEPEADGAIGDGESQETLSSEGHILKLKGIESGPDEIFYHVTSCMRKVINGNVAGLATWLSLTLTAFFFLNLYYQSVLAFLETQFTIKIASSFLGWDHQGDVFAIYSFFGAIVLMWLFNFEYRYVQRNNGRELDTYVTRYLAYLSTRFRRAEATVSRSIGGGTDEIEAEDAKSGLIRLQWLAWRTFFVEWFLRGVLYQVRRNSSYYTFGIPAAFILVAFFAFDWWAAADIKNLLYTGRSLILLGTLFVILGAFYLFILVDSTRPIREAIDERAWIEFHDLNLEETTDRVISRFLTEIQNWRDRFSGRHQM